MDRNWERVMKECKQIYQDHWNTCTESPCATCCRNTTQDIIEFEPERQRRLREQKKD